MLEAIAASTLSFETGDCGANSGTASRGSSSSSLKLRETVALLLELSSSCGWLVAALLSVLPYIRRTREMPRGKVKRRTRFENGLHGFVGAVGSDIFPPYAVSSSCRTITGPSECIPSRVVCPRNQQ